MTTMPNPREFLRMATTPDYEVTLRLLVGHGDSCGTLNVRQGTFADYREIRRQIDVLKDRWELSGHFGEQKLRVVEVFQPSRSERLTIAA